MIRSEYNVALWVAFAVVMIGGGRVSLGDHNPGMEPPDPFTLDESPRALAFKEAWMKARQEHAQLDPPPAGISGEEQREKVAAALERAVALMPEAPPCASLLSLVGRLWNSSAVAPEEPDKAIQAYERLLQEYPRDHRCKVEALGGLAYAYFLKGQYTQAATRARELANYQPPDVLDPDLISYIARNKEEAGKLAKWYGLAAVGIHMVGKDMLIADQRLEDTLALSLPRIAGDLEAGQAVQSDVLEEDPTQTPIRNKPPVSSESAQAPAQNETPVSSEPAVVVLQSRPVERKSLRAFAIAAACLGALLVCLTIRKQISKERARP
jgi:tetratricopeptide (TPR) repeat protein